MVYDTCAEHALRELDEKNPLLEISESIVTAKMCGISPQQFETALKILSNDGKILILHRGRKDQKSLILPRIKPESLPESQFKISRINGTVIKLIDSSDYDINLEITPNQKSLDPESHPTKTPNKQETKKNEEIVSFKKETIKEKSKIDRPSFRSSLSYEEKKEQLDGFMAFCEFNELHLTEKDFTTWFKKHDFNKISDNLNLLISKKDMIDNHAKWLQKALTDDYSGTKSIIQMNKTYAENFKKLNNWNALTITKQYCRDEVSSNDYQFSLPCVQFQRMLQDRYELNIQIM